MGQARKSLWIETAGTGEYIFDDIGQARKSLWIETFAGSIHRFGLMVRLVRACGSKPMNAWSLNGFSRSGS